MKKVTLNALAAGIGLMAAMTGSASAQFYPRPFLYGGYYAGRIDIPAPMPRQPVTLDTSEIMEDLAQQGLRTLVIAGTTVEALPADPDALFAAVDDHRFLTERTGAGNVHLSHQFLGIAFGQVGFFHGCFLIFKTAILRSNRCAGRRAADSMESQNTVSQSSA